MDLNGLRVALRSVGCRTNQEEMTALAPELTARGCVMVDTLTDADVIVLNTCSVTGDTESKTRRLVNTFAKQAPSARIMLTGCLAQQLPERLKELPGTEWVVGNTEKRFIPDILAGDPGIFHHDFTGSNDALAIFDEHVPDPLTAGRTRFSVKVQEGCNFRCAYCIVPDLRGPSRSSAYAGVIDRVRRAADAGYKEIVVTGTHIGQFHGNDGERLPELLQSILAVDSGFRLRLSSLDPRDASPELFDLILAEQRICRHLHISVQSLAPDVLKGMGRTSVEYEKLHERLSYFTQREPFAGLGADFITGFPGESDESFEITLAATREFGFTYAHVFRYSKRPGTRAATMDGQIAEAVKAERSERLRLMLSQQRSAWVRRQIDAGIVHDIVVEHESPVKGVTGNYIAIEIPAAVSERNSLVSVRLTGFDPVTNRCSAILVSTPESRL